MDRKKTREEMKEHVVLWEGLLSDHIIELGPSGSFALDEKLAFTCWTKNVEMLLQQQCGKKVQILLEEVTRETSE